MDQFFTFIAQVQPGAKCPLSKYVYQSACNNKIKTDKQEKYALNVKNPNKFQGVKEQPNILLKAGVTLPSKYSIYSVTGKVQFFPSSNLRHHTFNKFRPECVGCVVVMWLKLKCSFPFYKQRINGVN